MTSALPHLSHVAPQQTSSPKPVSLRPRTGSLVYPKSHPGAAVFPVTDLLPAASSVSWRAPATVGTAHHPTNGCVPVANPPHLL